MRRFSPFRSWQQDTLAPWHPGTLAPWHPGTLAPWHPGTLAPWHPGTLAPWHPADFQCPVCTVSATRRITKGRTTITQQNATGKASI